MKEKELMARAIKKWGVNSQLDMVVEECAELIHAIQKRRRNRVTNYQVLEEGVDVELCLEQLKMIINLPDSWQIVRDAKLKRLEKLLDQEQTRFAGNSCEAMGMD